jgi:hypothetical protein
MINPEPTQPRVIELIPGEHYLVFTDPSAELPDEDAIEELRMIAYAQRKKETLGGPVELEAIATLAQAVATGVVTNYVWEGCKAAKEYVSRVRDRHRELKKAAEAAKPAEEAAKGALEAVQAAGLPGVPAAGSAITLSATGEDGSSLQVSCRSVDKRVEFQLDVAGAVIDVMIRPRPQE